MITLQSGETDKIIVTGSTPTPPTPVDPEPTPDPEEVVGNLIVTFNAMDGSLMDEDTIFIKRNMLGTSIEISPNENIIEEIDSFTINPSTISVTQINGNTLSVQIPTEVLEQDIELIVTLAAYGR